MENNLLENYSFKDIKKLAKEGKVYAGMTKTIVLKNGFTAVLEVLGVEHDYLPGGGKASFRASSTMRGISRPRSAACASSASSTSIFSSALPMSGG